MSTDSIITAMGDSDHIVVFVKDCNQKKLLIKNIEIELLYSSLEADEIHKKFMLSEISTS